MRCPYCNADPCVSPTLHGVMAERDEARARLARMTYYSGLDGRAWVAGDGGWWAQVRAQPPIHCADMATALAALAVGGKAGT